jgi:hypothetical protein
MGFFRRSTSSTTVARPVGVRFDPYLADADIRDTVACIASEDWSGAEQSIGDHPDPWLVVDLLTSDESPVRIGSFESWCRQAPSPRSVSLLGRAKIRAAWEIRGRASASSVRTDSWDGFFAGLRDAETTLVAAVEADPSSCDPWVGLITTARGLERDRVELRNRFHNAQSRQPFRPDACQTMLQSLCHKWGGSHEQMFAFARWVEKNAAPDSPARHLIHVAHLEFAIASNDEGVRLSSHLRRREVAAELLSNAERFLEATPREARAAHLPALNMFVLMLYPTDKRSAAALIETVARIAERPTPMPWVYFGDAIAPRYAAVRDERLIAARSF